MKRLIAPLIAAMAVAGCASGPTAAQRVRSAGSMPATDTHRGASAGAVRAGEAGALMGSNAAALTRMFGTPRLDLREGAAHKLQFTGTSCVLDAYLYAPREGAEPVVTHVDTRNLEGADVDMAGCVGALRRR
jgi:hypothetical protein